MNLCTNKAWIVFLNGSFVIEFSSVKVVHELLRGTLFYVRRVVNLMKTAKVNAYVMFIFGKIQLLSIHAI